MSLYLEGNTMKFRNLLMTSVMMASAAGFAVSAHAADDKTVQKKDKTVNEPVQFLLSKATQPYELVVNDIKKDLISGYVASPKVQQTRSN